MTEIAKTIEPEAAKAIRKILRQISQLQRQIGDILGAQMEVLDITPDYRFDPSTGKFLAPEEKK